MTPPALEIGNLRAGYQDVPVVHGINVWVNQGEVVALLGPNGAGKTTTLLTVSGLLPAISGEVRHHGKRLSGLRPEQIARSGVAHVPEDRALFHSLSVEENLRVGPAHDRDGIRAAVSYFPALSPLMGRKAGLLSGGEQQMLAIARALAGRPDVLIVDEASLGLSPIATAQLLPALRRIATESGCAILLVEQHVVLALAIADRAYVLSRGVVTAEGDARELATDTERIELAYLGSGGNEIE